MKKAVLCVSALTLGLFGEAVNAYQPPYYKVDAPCPRDWCAHIDSNDNAYKASVYTEKCIEWVSERQKSGEKIKFLKYVPVGKDAGCQVVIKVEDPPPLEIVDTVCPKNLCTYIESGDNALKAGKYTYKCMEWVAQRRKSGEKITFLNYVPIGSDAGCQLVISAHM